MASQRNKLSWIPAAWNVPSWIKAGVTTRHGGRSAPPFNALNLATHVGDDPDTVRWNRKYVTHLLKLSSEPVWLNQVHGNRIICAEKMDSNTADGIYTDTVGLVCTVMTADCVPVLLCNQAGTRVAAVHIGWKGFCSNIIRNAIKLYNDDLSDLSVWIGPHISKDHYEVGDDVWKSCLDVDRTLDKAFSKNTRGRWQADLEWIVRHTFRMYGIINITSSDGCTYAETDTYYSFRRDGQTGRMASMIWIDR